MVSKYSLKLAQIRHLNRLNYLSIKELLDLEVHVCSSCVPACLSEQPNITSHTAIAEATDSPATMTLELNHADLNGEKVIALPIVRFRNVSCLTVFAQENQAEDDDLSTRIEKIVVLGHAGDKMDVSSIKDVSKDQ